MTPNPKQEPITREGLRNELIQYLGLMDCINEGQIQKVIDFIFSKLPTCELEPLDENTVYDWFIKDGYRYYHSGWKEMAKQIAIEFGTPKPTVADRELVEALEEAINTVECDSLGVDSKGNKFELPWYRNAKKVLSKYGK